MRTLQKQSESNRLSLLQRLMQCLLQLKSRSAREASCYPAFMGNCPTLSHTCQPYLPVSGVDERNENAGRIQNFFFLLLVLIRLNEEGSGVQDFLLLPQEFESVPSDVMQARWRNVMCVGDLQMIKSMVVGFCSTGA